MKIAMLKENEFKRDNINFLGITANMRTTNGKLPKNFSSGSGVLLPGSDLKTSFSSHQARAFCSISKRRSLLAKLFAPSVAISQK